MIFLIGRLIQLIIKLQIRIKIERLIKNNVDRVMRGKSFLYKMRSCGIYLFGG